MFCWSCGGRRVQKASQSYYCTSSHWLENQNAANLVFCASWDKQQVFHVFFFFFYLFLWKPALCEAASGTVWNTDSIYLSYQTWTTVRTAVLSICFRIVKTVVICCFCVLVWQDEHDKPHKSKLSTETRSCLLFSCLLYASFSFRLRTLLVNMDLGQKRQVCPLVTWSFGGWIAQTEPKCYWGSATQTGTTLYITWYDIQLLRMISNVTIYVMCINHGCFNIEAIFKPYIIQYMIFILGLKNIPAPLDISPAFSAFGLRPLLDLAYSADQIMILDDTKKNSTPIMDIDVILLQYLPTYR